MVLEPLSNFVSIIPAGSEYDADRGEPSDDLARISCSHNSHLDTWTLPLSPYTCELLKSKILAAVG
jgi:hypothetical protein